MKEVIIESPKPAAWSRIKGNYALRTMVLCPWHEEKTPSLVIDGMSHDDEPAITYGTFRCFGCGKEGTMEAIGVGEVGKPGICLPEQMRLIAQ